MATANEANAIGALSMLFIAFAFSMSLAASFGYTCTSGTFDVNQFNAANCFVIEGLFESNTAITDNLTVPEVPCSDFTVLNCPMGRCQVDEVQGVCEDSGEPLKTVECSQARYQDENSCPIVGCEWGSGQCAKPGELCGYESDIQTCVNRDECNWDFFRPSYAVCLYKTEPQTPGTCEDLGPGRQADCTAAPGCVWSDDKCLAAV